MGSGPLECSPFYVSVFFETIESAGLDIFQPFQIVSVVLLYNLHSDHVLIGHFSISFFLPKC